MLRMLKVFCLVCFSAPTLAQEYQSKELADAALDWRQELIDSVPANKKQPNLSAALRRTAEIEYQAKDYTAAIGKLTSAIANGADDGLVWLRLAQSELAANDDHAMASAYNAYLKSTDPVERGAALFVIGRDYDRHDKQKEALRVRRRARVHSSVGNRRTRRGVAPARRLSGHQGRGSGGGGGGARLPALQRANRGKERHLLRCLC